MPTPPCSCMPAGWSLRCSSPGAERSRQRELSASTPWQRAPHTISGSGRPSLPTCSLLMSSLPLPSVRCPWPPVRLRQKAVFHRSDLIVIGKQTRMLTEWMQNSPRERTRRQAPGVKLPEVSPRSRRPGPSRNSNGTTNGTKGP